jgi:DNA invertase Pin-like site-specific DNA recombinase
VYLRQSSPRQVRENVRSTERQYALADRAAELGWEPARILTVDGDLGVSGRDTHRRDSYKELVGRVCESEVGADLRAGGRKAGQKQRRAVAAA